MLPQSVSTFLLLIICAATGFAQDPYYLTAPVNDPSQNPAFAGTSFQHRLSLRHQALWIALPGSYTNSSFVYDSPAKICRGKFGIGLNGSFVNQGPGTVYFRNMDLNLSYQIPLCEKLKSWNIAIGLNAGLIGSFGTMPGLNGNLGSGLIIFNSRIWTGFSIDHLNQPQFAMPAGGGFIYQTPGKRIYSVHTGYRQPVSGQDKSRFISLSGVFRGGENWVASRMQLMYESRYIQFLIGDEHSMRRVQDQCWPTACPAAVSTLESATAFPAMIPGLRSRHPGGRK